MKCIVDVVHHNSPVQRDTLIDFFRDLVTIRGEFLVYDDGYRRRTHTYEEVGRAARGFAARLAAAGLRKGDKVVFWGENRPEWIACYWGCLHRRHHRRADRLPLVGGVRARRCRRSSRPASMLDRRRGRRHPA